jgi:hypothetical protein
MKKILLISLVLFFHCAGNCQILKKLGQKAKENAQWRIERTENEKINEGLDSLQNLPKKIRDKKKSKEEDSNIQVSQKQNSSNTKQREKNTLSASGKEDNDMSPKDGYVTINLSSSNVFARGNITISGESILYKNYNQVEIIVSGKGIKDSKLIPLSKDGKYSAGWNAPDKAGNFTVTVKGSDKKSSQSVQITVYELPGLENWCDKNIDVTNKAYDKLKDEVEKVSSSIGSKDKAELDKKMGDVKEKVNSLLKLFTDLNSAGKQIASLAKTAKNLSPNLAGNLSELNNTLDAQRKKMELIEEYSDHQPADNTVCEYLVMLNEACAAFSVYTNVESKALVTIIGNIQLDKAVPKAVSMVNEQKGWFEEPNDFAIKEPAKIFATAGVDAKSLSSQLGVAGFAGDMVQFATDFLMKKYCGVFKGTFNHDYTIEFRNDKGENWWTYGVKMRAVVALRYPKNKDGVNVIKMKGNLEGNATNFSFFEDVEKDDDFQEGSKGKIEVVPIKTFTPLSVSFATSEKDILGFGAVARGLATPAYFNIPIDAEYDVNTEKIKIFINPAIVDFSIFVANKLVFALVGGDLLPYLKQMTFPIHKAATTIGSVVRGNNEFDMVKDKKGNLSFSGKANKHLGNKTDKIEHDLNFTITATKQ